MMMSPTSTLEKPERVIREAEFAKRITHAADMHPHCPPLHQGRLVWIADQMRKRGHKVSNESIRKWFYGEAKPSGAKPEALAEILEVDAPWLLMGVDPNISPREKRARNATAEGVVNVVAGLIQMDGGHPAFPEESDQRADKESIDLYAILKGANYALHISAGVTSGDEAMFAVPTTIGENVIVIGLCRVDMCFHLFELTPDDIREYGSVRGASTEVTVDPKNLRRIEGFTQRL